MTPEELELQRLIAAASAEGNDALVQQLESVAQLPPEQQAEVIRQLSQDYEGRDKTLRDELETNYGLLTQQSPQGQVAGNNQFSVYVGASPLEHLASGIQKYQAGKGIREGKKGLEGLSADKEAGLSRVQQGMLAEILREKEEEQKRGFRMPGRVY